MHRHNPDGFQQRQPYAKKTTRFPKHPIGPNERWAADGHDKLKQIGFPIYAILDDATSKYLGLYVVPDNRNRNADIVTWTLSRSKAVWLTVWIFVHSLTALS
jgi:hypothetical protein